MVNEGFKKALEAAAKSKVTSHADLVEKIQNPELQARNAIRDTFDDIQKLQQDFTNLRNQKATETPWKNLIAEIESLRNRLNAENLHDRLEATGNIALATEVETLATRIDNFKKDAEKLEESAPSDNLSSKLATRPSSTAPIGQAPAALSAPPARKPAPPPPSLPPVRIDPPRHGDTLKAHRVWEKELKEMEAKPTPLAQLDEDMAPEAMVADPNTAPLAPVAHVINDKAFSGALARFKDPAFLKDFVAQLSEDAKTGSRETQKMFKAMKGLEVSLSKLSPEKAAEDFEAYARATIEGSGMDELLKKGNVHATAASTIAASEIVSDLESLAHEIVEQEMPEKPDIYAKESAPLAGAVHQRIRGVMGLDIAFAVIAGSSAFSGGVKSTAALVSQLPDTVRAGMLQFLENPLMSGSASLELLIKGMVGGAAYFMARQIVAGKDIMREAGVKYPNQRSLPASFTHDPAVMTRATIAVMVASAFAAHGFNYAIIGSKLMSEYATEALVPLKPVLDAIEAARKTVNAVPTNIDAFFKAYISAEKNGVQGLQKDMTPEELALYKSMGWKFSPTNPGDGPITAAKRYALFREATPKLTPKDKEAIDKLFAGYGISADRGLAHFAVALSHAEMSPVGKPLERSQIGLKDYIEHLQSTGPVAHFLYELSFIYAQSGQEVPNLLTALETSKASFAAGYTKFTQETWQKVVQTRFNETMTAIGSKADALDMKFPPVNVSTSGAIPTPPHVSPIPFMYSDEEYKILHDAVGAVPAWVGIESFDTTEKRAAWNMFIALLYGTIDTATVLPSIGYSRKRREYLGEKEPAYERSLEEVENQLAMMLASYLNNTVKISARTIAGIDLTPVSVSSIRSQLYERARQEVADLKSEKQLSGIKNLIGRTALSWRRLLQMPLGERIEERLAYQGWLEAQVDKIKKNKLYVGELLGELQPDFKPLFEMAQKVNKDPRSINDVGAEYVKNAQKRVDALNKRILRTERAAATGEVALYDKLMQRLYADPYINDTLNRYAEHPIAIPLDGSSEVAITNNEVTFYIASEIERRRRHALNTLVSLARREESLEALEWAQNATTPETRAALPQFTSVQPKGLLDRAREEIGDVAADVMEQVENEIRLSLFGRQNIDPDAIAAQITLVNQHAVSRIREVIAAEGKNNPLSLTQGGYDGVITYEYEKAYARPMLQVHTSRDQIARATVVYPGYVPYFGDAIEGDAAVTERLAQHIVNWYQNTGQYELAARALTYETKLAIEKTEEEIKSVGAQRWADLRFSINTVARPLENAHGELFARLNLLKELYERRSEALTAVTREMPMTPQQLDAFARDQLVILGGSAVPETSQRLLFILNGIRDELIARGLKNEVVYDIQFGKLFVGDQSVQIQSIKTPKQFVDEYITASPARGR